MRIIHTADWHLCNRLGRVDRTADLQARVETLAALCEEHAADVLLVAGDVFDDRAEPDPITASFNHILKTFDRFFLRGGTILAVTGNHDRDGKMNMVQTGMWLASPFARSAEGRIAGGRMYLNNRQGFATLADKDGNAVQFVFVPYPFPSRYDLSGTEVLAKEELHKVLQARVAEWLQKVTSKEHFDVTLPTVLIAHLHVRGSEITTAYKMNDADDVLVPLADLNPSWAYVALGHVHKPQTLGAAHVRYPGSLDRLDITESHEHGAVLFEIAGKQLAGEPQYLPIPSTPFHHIRLENLDEELPALAEKYPDHEQAIVKVEIAPRASEVSKDEAARHLRKLFPRMYELKWNLATPTAAEENAPRVNTKASLEDTVRGYLVTHGELQADADKGELLKLAESFLTSRES